MKKIFLLVIVCMTLIVACKKSSGSGTVSSGYYITCNLNGAARSYGLKQVCNFSDSSVGGQNVSIFLLQGISQSLQGIQITALSTAALPSTAGTVFIDTSTAYTLSCSDISAGNINFWSLIPAGDTVTNPFTMTITAINGSVISGTFQGILYDPEDDTKTEIVTNGKFNVPYQKK